MPQLTKALLAKEAEDYALGQVFCTYPCDKTYQEIIAICTHERNDELIDEHNLHMEESQMDEECYTLCEEYQDMWWDHIEYTLEPLRRSCYYRFQKYCIDHEDY